MSLTGQRSFGTTRASLGVTLEAARSGFQNSTYDAAQISLKLSPDWRLGGACCRYAVWC